MVQPREFSSTEVITIKILKLQENKTHLLLKHTKY